MGPCSALSSKSSIFAAAMFCLCVLTSRSVKLPAMSVPEMRNLLRYTVWNLLTFSPHLRPLMVDNFMRVYRMHTLPDGSEYRIRVDNGAVDGLYRLEFDGDDIRSSGTLVKYKISFTANEPTYYSAVAPYDPYHKAYLYKNQTSYLSKVAFCIYLDVDTVSGNGSLWYVDMSDVRFIRSRSGKNTEPELFSGLWYQNTMKEIVTTSVLGYQSVRKAFSKILNNHPYLSQG